MNMHNEKNQELPYSSFRIWPVIHGKFWLHFLTVDYYEDHITPILRITHCPLEFSGLYTEQVF